MRTFVALAATASTMALLVANTAHAQVQDDSAETYSSTDIVVTAQKRAQKLSDVGITIAAPSAEQLSTAGVVDVSQLAKVVPGFSTGTTSVGGYKVFSMRGVNFNADMISAPPAVSVYVDEAGLPYSAMTGGLLLDVERVEVLKGPQGTLFGQNATGGSINVIAAKPTSAPKAGFKGEVDHFGGVMVEGFASGPLSDTLRARVSGTTTQFGAWQKGFYLNNDKHGDQNRGAARLLLDWTPTDRLTIALNVNGNYDHGELQQYQYGGFAPTAPGGEFPGLINYPIPGDNRDADVTPGRNIKSHNRMLQSVARIDYEFSDAATLTSITNYADAKIEGNRDADGVAYDTMYFQAGGRIKSFSQELRVSGNVLDSRLNYILGGNLTRDRIVDINNNFFPGYSALPTGASLETTARVRNNSAGVFGNIDFVVIDKLTLTGGVRYTKTKQRYAGCMSGNAMGAVVLTSIANAFRGIAGLPPTDAYQAGGCLTINNDVSNTPTGPDYLPIFGNRTQKEDNVSWRAGINFKPTSDSLIYGLVSSGYKAGLIPVQQNLLNSALQPISQEKLTSYEVGGKFALFDRALRFNVSGFYYQYRDKQFFTFKPVPVVGYGSDVVNIPKSTVKGFDIDAVLTPAEGLTLRGALTYIKTKIGTFVTFDSRGNVVDATGKEFNYASPLSGTFDIDYRHPVSETTAVTFGFGGQYASRTYSVLGEAPNSRLPAFLTLDARIGLESEKGWRVGLFARNLNNDSYYTATFATGDEFVRLAGRPRVFGANFGFNF